MLDEATTRLTCSLGVCVCALLTRPLLSLYRADIADCQTSVFHKASDKTEVGLSTRYNLQTSNVSLGLATKYTLNDGAILKVSARE